MTRLVTAGVLLVALARPATAIDLTISVTGPGGAANGLTILNLWNVGVTTAEFNSGQFPAGRVASNPFTMTRRIDIASPKFFQACMAGPTTVTLEGSERGQLVFKIQLTGATATKQRSVSSHLETFSFTYQKMSWTWVRGGVTKNAAWGRALE
jgi:type VI secretion system Hcp family effector